MSLLRRRAMLASLCLPLAGVACAQTVESSADGVETWITSALKTEPTKTLAGPFDLRKFRDPVFILLNAISWRPPTRGPYSHLKPVHVPAWFVTDLISIPRVFWILVRPDSDAAYAAVIHDYLYWIQDRTRAEADLVFRSAMEDLKITDLIADPLFHAVDTLGGRAWDKNAGLRAAGEKRILSKLPVDPALTWNEWKRGDVFVRN